MIVMQTGIDWVKGDRSILLEGGTAWCLAIMEVGWQRRMASGGVERRMRLVNCGKQRVRWLVAGDRAWLSTCHLS
jgi:hypothetical protein